MPHIEIKGEQLFYTLSQAAQGPPAMVLVHGAGGTHLHWPGELRRLSGVSVYALDLPGHGRSGGKGRDTIVGYAETVAAFLRAVGVGRAIVTGHSMGGAVAQTMALDFSDRVTGLILVGTGGRLRVAPAILERVQTDFAKSVELITRFAWSPDAPPRLSELGRQALLETGPDVLLGDFAACNRFDVMERLAEIQVPTLAVTGTADQLTPVKYARFLAESIPGARLTTIEGAGHMVMLERPTEVERAVRKFLRDTRGD